MKSKIAVSMVALVTIALLVGCASVPKVKAPEIKVPVSGPLFQIQYSPGNPRTTVGGTVVLTAKGVDKEAREVDINPTWKSDAEGKVEPSVGKTVTFTALKSGVCYVEVSQGEISNTIAIEIK